MMVARLVAQSQRATARALHSLFHLSRKRER